ncbi:Adaptor complexes medium subunit family protein [Leishmania donovani]|uniref:Adaptor complexes medium subunit family protein n=1 Tax=Leishmania donovani TaxID=5661 RepID=A0A504X8G8_LEIDO|nr:Adaptor complexes medium subunit family protein [Leishmania donovani]
MDDGGAVAVDHASVETPDAVNGGSAAQSSAKSDAYRFPAGEVMDAVKKRDFNAMQTHATKLVQSQWKEEYNVPAACVVIFIVMWYWIAWTRRSIRRKCEATKASVKQQTDEMVEIVRNMTEKWKVDMSKANKQMQGIIDKNSELTRDIDRMTTALRSCSIRPTAASAAAIAPTVSVVKRVDPVDEEAPAEATETAAGESSEALAMLEFMDYREDIPDNTYKAFFRRYSYPGQPYAFAKRRHLFVVCATPANTLMSVLAEFLIRTAQLLTDYLGIVSEEIVRNNFTLVHELLDRVGDFGVVETEANRLQPFTVNDVVPTAVSVLKVDLLERNEAYVKFLERVAVVFNACGTVVATVKGALALKSFLAGTPSVTVGLSSEVVLRDELTDGQPLHPPGANVLEVAGCAVGVKSSADNSLTWRPAGRGEGGGLVNICAAAVDRVESALSLNTGHQAYLRFTTAGEIAAAMQREFRPLWV